MRVLPWILNRYREVFLRRWRQEVAVTLQLGNFAIYGACCRSVRDGGGSHAAPDGGSCLVADLLLGT